MPNVSDSSARVGPYPACDPYADDTGDAPYRPSGGVISTVETPVLLPSRLEHSNVAVGCHWSLDAGVSVATSKGMGLECDHSRS